MTAARYDIVIEVGCDFTLMLTWKDSAGDAIDLTGWIADLMIRSDPADPVPLVSLTDDSGLTLGGTAGTIAIDIPAAATATLAAGFAGYDLKLTDSNGRPMRLLQGDVTINPAVTR